MTRQAEQDEVSTPQRQVGFERAPLRHISDRSVASPRRRTEDRDRARAGFDLTE